MKFLLVLGLTVASFIFCEAAVGTPCTSQEQCAADECCQIINIVVVSKRQALKAVGPNTSGSCAKYQKEGESCSSLNVLNGYCGCQPDLSCTPIPFSNTRQRRKMEMPAQCTAK